MTVSALKSLSTKDLGYTAKEVRKLVDGKGSEKQFIACIGGVVKEIITGESKHGEWNGFKGVFYAVNAKGEKFSSNLAFLPSNLSKRLVEGWVEGALEIELPPADIFAVESDKNASGYAYMCDFMLSDENIQKADKIASAIFNSKMPTLLTGPVEQEKKAKKTA